MSVVGIAKRLDSGVDKRTATVLTSAVGPFPIPSSQVRNDITATTPSENPVACPAEVPKANANSFANVSRMASLLNFSKDLNSSLFDTALSLIFKYQDAFGTLSPTERQLVMSAPQILGENDDDQFLKLKGIEHCVIETTIAKLGPEHLLNSHTLNQLVREALANDESYSSVQSTLLQMRIARSQVNAILSPQMWHNTGNVANQPLPGNTSEPLPCALPCDTSEPLPCDASEPLPCDASEPLPCDTSDQIRSKQVSQSTETATHQVPSNALGTPSQSPPRPPSCILSSAVLVHSPGSISSDPAPHIPGCHLETPSPSSLLSHEANEPHEQFAQWRPRDSSFRSIDPKDMAEYLSARCSSFSSLDSSPPLKSNPNRKSLDEQTPLPDDPIEWALDSIKKQTSSDSIKRKAQPGNSNEGNPSKQIKLQKE